MKNELLKPLRKLSVLSTVTVTSIIICLHSGILSSRGVVDDPHTKSMSLCRV